MLRFLSHGSSASPKTSNVTQCDHPRPCWVRLGVLSLFSFGWVSVASATVTLQVLTGSYMHLSGTSNLTEWECMAPVRQGQLTLDIPFDAVQSFLQKTHTEPETISDTKLQHITSHATAHVQQADLSVPVRHFVFDNKRMEKDMHNAFRVEKHPLIRFSFSRLAGLSIAHKDEQPILVLHTEGLLDMAGVSKLLVLDLQVTLNENGHIQVVAVKHTHMTTFDMTPPEALLGLIKARDPVVVRFELQLGPQASQKA